MKHVNEREVKNYAILSKDAWIEDNAIVQNWYERLNVKQNAGEKKLKMPIRNGVKMSHQLH